MQFYSDKMIQQIIFAMTLITIGSIVAEDQIAILRQEQNQEPDGSYNFLYEAENGIAVQEQGYQENPGTPDEGSVKIGQYQYIDPNGDIVSTSYIADKNGFRAEGTHIPKKPSTPDFVLKTLKTLLDANEITQEEFDRYL